MLRDLLAASARPDARDFIGQTPLHITVAHGHLECFNVLTDPDNLQHWADALQAHPARRSSLKDGSELARAKLNTQNQLPEPTPFWHN